MKQLLCGLLAAIVLLAGCGGDAQNQPKSQSEAPASESAPVSSAVENVPPSSEGQASEPESLTWRLTIPEGYTLARIAMTLEEKEICTVEEFIDAAQNGDFSEFALVAQQGYDENRCFTLEGYLYPDTYEFYTGAGPDAIIRAMLGHMESRITEDMRAQISQSGYSADEIITLASIIEKEALGPEQMPMISSVLHNRLNSGMQLQCDVTIKYVEGAIKPFITGDVDRYNSYYNTYKCPALPAGAICNPRIEAIQAALQPAESGYYYFLTDEDGNYYYAETLEEHNANRAETGV